MSNFNPTINKINLKLKEVIKFLISRPKISCTFVVRLCGDVLLDVLCWGERRRLTKLEQFGRRFHRIIEVFFNERPFLVLGYEIDPRF